LNAHEIFGKLKVRDKLNLFSVLVAFAAIVGIQFLSLGYLQFVVMYFISYSIFAASWDLLHSYSGQLSLGHALPFGVGAFATLVIALRMAYPLIVALILGSVLASVVGGLVMLSTIRLRPAYQGIAVFLFSQLLYYFTFFLYGEEGVYASTGSVSYGLNRYLTSSQTYWLGAILFLLSVSSIYALENSRIRIKLLAIRGDPVAAEATGIRVSYYKTLVSFVSCFFAGVGGAIYAAYTIQAGFLVFDVRNSFLPVAMAIIGGLGRLGGVIIGSALVTGLTTVLPIWFNVAITYLVYGLAMFLVMRFFPEGLSGLLRKLWAVLI